MLWKKLVQFGKGFFLIKKKNLLQPITIWGGSFDIPKLLGNVGQVGNVGVTRKSLGRAGSKCWLGKRPVVRGAAMNPVDHPHGGGEGKAPIGRKKPATPWGYPALGRKSRKRRKYSDSLILRRRK
ncbi:hypothetical protein LUZ62_012322 [Rhynchospora pubera]|uniref:Large ribosomal subunit protein uL2 C-terminal domain-containing protein n=1 Tax=Rhynchospora pubera TaxID=906938 RepID=A0AAV8BIV4_9POAL|nr:hypothetical protein LUZ62_012322 [Rhynchospora pubera]